MKRFFLLSAIAVSLTLFILSCNDEETTDYWYNYGTYIETVSNPLGFVIELDSGDTLIPSQIDYMSEDLKDSSRVLAYFSIEVDTTEKVLKAGYLDVYSILTKEIVQLTTENQDSIGDDGVDVTSTSLWLSKNHLNVIFSYYGGGNVMHYINLVKPIQDTLDDEGRIILELRHNANNDPYSNYLTGIVSFDMHSLYQPGMDSINFLFKSISYLDYEFSWEGTYHFTNQSSNKAFTIKALNPNRDMK